MRMLMLALMVVLLRLGAAHADTIYMKTGLKIDGKVHIETPEYVILLVYNESGRVRIPRDQIDRIEYDFATKAAKIKADDVKGQYELGVWAMEKGMYAEAIAQFEKVKGQGGADTLKRLGELYERRSLLEKAHENYKNYLLTHPDDSAVKQKVDDLANKLGLAVGSNPVLKPKVVEGHEVHYRWNGEKWPNQTNTCAVSLVPDPNTGNQMLAIQAQAGNLDKIAFSGKGAALDLSASKEIIFKVFHNLPQNAILAIAFKNKDNEYFESKQLSVPAQAWSNQTLKIDGNDFKCKKSEWAFTSPIEGRDNIKEIIVLVHTQRDMTMYMDFIFFR